jgi:hypothetical protein
MGCSASKVTKDTVLHAGRPAEVACAACGSVNYLDAGKESVRCFGCKQPVSRSDFGATGLQGDLVKAPPPTAFDTGAATRLGTW